MENSLTLLFVVKLLDAGETVNCHTCNSNLNLAAITTEGWQSKLIYYVISMVHVDPMSKTG